MYLFPEMIPECHLYHQSVNLLGAPDDLDRKNTDSNRGANPCFFYGRRLSAELAACAQVLHCVGVEARKEDDLVNSGALHDDDLLDTALLLFLHLELVRLEVGVQAVAHIVRILSEPRRHAGRVQQRGLAELDRAEALHQKRQRMPSQLRCGGGGIGRGSL